MKIKMKLLATAITAVTVVTSSTVLYAAEFNDVPDNSPYSIAVEYFKDNGLMNGISDTEFLPDENTSRAMLVTILYHQQGSPQSNHNITFNDVDRSSWYYDAVKWADSNDIISGYDELHFGPDDLLTREQIISILWRISGSPNTNGTITYSDASDIADYAKTSIVWAYENNIISNTNDIFSPKEYVTRGETALMIYNMLNIEKTNSEVSEVSIETTTELINELSTEISVNNNNTTPDIHVTFNNSEFDVVLYPSPLATALLEEVPETQMMLPPSYDENSIYKYYDLPWILDIIPDDITQAKAGDILLNDEGRLFLYYKTGELNGNFMRIGYVTNTTELAEKLGDGSVNFYVSQY